MTENPTIEPFSYAATPKGYVCGECGQGGVKLWRVAASSCIRLFCVVCVCKKERDVNPLDFDANGEHPIGFCNNGAKWLGLRSDQVGGCVAAVPCEDGSGWYGYTSIPEEGVAWWRRLPTLGNRKAVFV